MYPTLFHAFKDLFGIELSFLKLINSFGFFVAIAFLIGHVVLRKEMARKEALGHFSAKKATRIVGEKTKITEYLFNGLLGFLLGFKALGMFLDRAEVFAAGNTPQTYLLSTKGNLIGDHHNSCGHRWDRWGKVVSPF